jgi:predicted CopG family antitoxin
MVSAMGKTITIDDEAYKILSSHKFGRESFSEVIKKHMAEALMGDELLKALGFPAEPPKRKSRRKHESAGR